MTSERREEMQVEIKIDASCAEPKVTIHTASMTEEVCRMLNRLSEHVPEILSGIRNERTEVIEQEELIRVYANAGKVFAVTETGEYAVRLRLYEIEERLPANKFVRISNSEIINLRKVKNFDLSFTGTICVEFKNGTKTFVSRRYVSKIRKILGI